MNFRLAETDDLPEIIKVYAEIVRSMKENGLDIWDEVYPCEFFSDDIKNRCLYVLTNGDEIVSAFALYESNEEAPFIKWPSGNAKVIYLERFGVNVNCSCKTKLQYKILQEKQIYFSRL